jgi:hypothetical protein
MTRSESTDMTGQPNYDGWIEQLKVTKQSMQAKIDAIEGWTPKLQMLLEQHYIITCVIEAIEKELEN